MLTYYLFRLGAWVGPHLPVWLAFAICDGLGWLFFWLLRAKRHTVLCNLAHVLPEATLQERQKIGQGMFQSNLKNYYDLFRTHGMSRAHIEAAIEVRGLENVREAEKHGKGIVAISAHIGSFSLVPQLATSVEVDFNLTVEPLQPPLLFELVRSLREVDPRCKLISVAGSELRNIFRALKRNQMVCLAIDRDVTGNGVPQKFFGAEAILPTGAAEIALRINAMVMPIHIYRTPDRRNVLHFKPAFLLEHTADHSADLNQANIRLLSEIEQMILDTPDQWVVLQPVWPDCH